MKVHYLQHVDFEGPAYIESWCEQKHHEISGTRFFEADYELPLLNSFDILIVLGGPMSVYDETDYPWLKTEKDFISSCIAAGKKVVGICLGAQLSAVCLGAKVIKAANKEIGWFPVYPTENCLQKAWFYDLFSANPKVFHWHGETFQIPANSMDLLSSEANPNQAFYIRTRF
ncbi:type 1 glutamine amidotransferase [Pedobacter aquatilis]|uniref:type 1 glutamine amidotransferase n=1 Tax=Pedobacter aquatilis TaxID=351343 RepID=UPI002930A6D6|nr:type 1 glutamine amidotransferase [Pedobacter aquatilis]